MKIRTAEKTFPSRRTQLGLGAVIFALIWIVFGQTLGHDFVNYDDKTYVYGNALVSGGLTFHGLAQALVDTQTRNWHPLTIISHMIDCQFYDLKAGGHHFTNVLLHTVAALLLATTPAEIIDIASDCGYDNLSYFYRRFRRQYGKSPRAWRMEAQFVAMPLRQ